MDIASSQTCIAICDTHGNTRNHLISHIYLRLAFSVSRENTSNEIDSVFTLRKPGDCWDLNVRRTNPGRDHLKYLTDSRISFSSLYLYGGFYCDYSSHQNSSQVREFPKLIFSDANINLLSTRPIVVTTEIFCGLHPRTVPGSTQLVGLSGYTRGILKWTIRIVTNIIIILIAILIPSFDVIMAFLGSALTFTICIILPLLFYLKLFGNQVSRMERIFDWFLIIICTAISLVGTVWVFIPKAVLGAG